MNNVPEEVLLVEDNPGDADLVRLHLVDSGVPAKLDCVTRLSDGLERLNQKRHSLVLLDLNLPDSHGVNTLRQVLEKAPGIPVLVLSGQTDEALAVTALQHGVQDYIAKKDLTGEKLSRAMRFAIERQALLRSLEIARQQQLESKNELLSRLSGELHAPLRCILRYAKLLLDGIVGNLNAEQRDYLRNILRIIEQLNATISDLIEASRAVAEKLEGEPRLGMPPRLIGQSLSVLREAARTAELKLATADSDFTFILCDPDRLLKRWG